MRFPGIRLVELKKVTKSFVASSLSEKKRKITSDCNCRALLKIKAPTKNVMPFQAIFEEIDEVPATVSETLRIRYLVPLQSKELSAKGLNHNRLRSQLRHGISKSFIFCQKLPVFETNNFFQ